jgi:hypothetical protein
MVPRVSSVPRLSPQKLTRPVDHDTEATAMVYPRIDSTDVDGLICNVIAETDLIREPPDHHAPGEAPEVQHDGGGPREFPLGL